jgi:hypothetical protein
VQGWGVSKCGTALAVGRLMLHRMSCEGVSEDAARTVGGHIAALPSAPPLPWTMCTAAALLS